LRQCLWHGKLQTVGWGKLNECKGRRMLKLLAFCVALFATAAQASLLHDNARSHQLSFEELCAETESGLERSVRSDPAHDEHAWRAHHDRRSDEQPQLFSGVRWADDSFARHYSRHHALDNYCPTPVPEPEALVALLVGAGMIVWRYKRHRWSPSSRVSLRVGRASHNLRAS
jgi:hypothetical protein